MTARGTIGLAFARAIGFGRVLRSCAAFLLLLGMAFSSMALFSEAFHGEVVFPALSHSAMAYDAIRIGSYRSPADAAGKLPQRAGRLVLRKRGPCIHRVCRMEQFEQ